MHYFFLNVVKVLPMVITGFIYSHSHGNKWLGFEGSYAKSAESTVIVKAILFERLSEPNLIRKKKKEEDDKIQLDGNTEG